MCGIFGVFGSKNVSLDILSGLARLEYRGYDSSGIAAQFNQRIGLRKASGKLSQLRELLHSKPLTGTVGIGHTRWATHGSPSTKNAHPHACGSVAVVHNGIIENYHELYSELTSAGHTFESCTDSEVIPHLIQDYLDQGYAGIEAVKLTLNRLQGAYALGILIAGEEEQLIAARKDSPLVIGSGAKGLFIASDSSALEKDVNQVIYLENGDVATLNHKGVTVFDKCGQMVERLRKKLTNHVRCHSKSGYQHYMLKEIYQQPQVTHKTLHFEDAAYSLDFNETSRLSIVACGTSYYAGMVAKYWFEQYARLPVDIDIASEYRYRHTPIAKNDKVLFISQSGETADTLAALEYAKSQGAKTLSIVNVDGSSIARSADIVIKTLAGKEVGVASTKAFTTQLVVLAKLVIHAAKHRAMISDSEIVEMTQSLQSLPDKIAAVLSQADLIDRMAAQLVNTEHILYLGRGSCFPIALEGALKLKEITYIHAEGYAAGELKHGPIALIKKDTPVVVVLPENLQKEKAISNIREVMARGAKVFLFSDKQTINTLDIEAHQAFELPKTDDFLSPIVAVIPLQLLAYKVALLKGCNIDQPRNLAKSVTVE